MKKCSICKILKDEKEFPFQNKKLNKYMSACKNCNSTRQKEKRINNPEEVRKKDKIQYLKHQQKRIKQAKDYRDKYPERTRNTNLKVKYGITQNDYNYLKIKQNNKCAICGEDEENLKRILCVDHCHKTNKIRGLLCDTCNKFLGFYESKKNECEIYLKNNGEI
jgi:hypothetical protein